MAVTRAQRDEAYENASIAVQRLCNDPESGHQLFAIAKRHDIADYDRTYRAYALAVGDVALGFFSERELPELLIENAGLDRDTAQAIADDLHNFFAPLYSSDPQGSAPPIEITGTGSDEVPRITGDTAVRWESERTERTARITPTYYQSLPENVHAAPVHRSYQDDSVRREDRPE